MPHALPASVVLRLLCNRGHSLMTKYYCCLSHSSLLPAPNPLRTHTYIYTNTPCRTRRGRATRDRIPLLQNHCSHLPSGRQTAGQPRRGLTAHLPCSLRCMPLCFAVLVLLTSLALPLLSSVIQPCHSTESTHLKHSLSLPSRPILTP
jgi:hypothetical protein